MNGGMPRHTAEKRLYSENKNTFFWYRFHTQPTRALSSYTGNTLTYKLHILPIKTDCNCSQVQS